MVNEIGNLLLDNINQAYCIRVGSLTTNMESSHFCQDRVKDHMSLSDLDLSQMSLKLKLVIGCQVCNTRRYLSNNNNDRECHLKATHHLLKT
ncbi:hypothetical protein CR513_33616, partial [Mucuna pruriens]